MLTGKKNGTVKLFPIQLFIPSSIGSFCSCCSDCPTGFVLGPFLVPFNPD